MNISKLARSINNDNSDFPPVHLWNPDLCIGQEITINREGEWLYYNSPIKNIKLVKLFSSVLRNDNGNYFLVTPSEKIPVFPEVAPYIITDFTLDNSNIILHTNVDYTFTLDTKNTTRLIEYENSTIPLVHVRSNIEGFFCRSTYYNLINLALDENIVINKILHIKSGNNHYPLGTIA